MALALVVMLGASLAPASAQSAARKKAEDVLRQGIQAQSRRDHNAAVALLTEAVNSGALARNELGLALYRRAISYRAQKQPALAISDLNSALFFEDALPSKERAGAIELRLKSYRDAGLQAPALATSTPRAPNTASIQAPGGPVSSGPRIVNTAPPRVNAPVRRVEPRRSLSNLPPSAPILGSSQASATPVAPPSAQSSSIPAFTTQTLRGAQRSTPTITTRTTVPTAVASVRSRPSSVPTAAWSTATRKVEPRSSAPAAVATSPFTARAETAARFTPPRTPAPTAWRNPEVARSTAAATSATVRSQAPASYQSSLPAPRATGTAAAAERSADAASSGVSAGGAGVGGFLSSLFGQSTASDEGVPRTTTSSLSQSAGTAARDTAGERLAAVSPPAAPKPAADPPEKRAKGFDIEIVALHDRYRAEAVAKQIMVQYSSDFFWSSRKTRVEERAGPDGATLYAVRLGRYDDESSARSFCKKLEAGGFDCDLVVRR